VQAATEHLSKLFEDDPCITYVLCSMTREQRLAYLPAYFDVLLTAAAMNNATFEEINDWGSCAVMMPPGSRVDNPFTILQSGFISVLWNIGVGGCSRMFSEIVPKSDAAKKKGLKKGEKYYYLFFIGTQEERKGQGLATAMIQRYQNIAAREGCSIWLESTTPHSMGIYTHLGFETVEAIILGKGKVAPDGTTMQNGDGVGFWAMIWRPAASSQ